MILQDLVELQLLTAKNTFLKKLSASALLIRLDERGGKSEVSTWAFDKYLKKELTLPLEKDIPVEWKEEESKTIPDDVVEAQIQQRNLLAQNIGFDQDTYTLSQANLPIPYAGEAAQIYLLAVERNSFVVGRDAEFADLLFDEKCVSRKHAVIKLINNRFEIKDIDSFNGTFLHRKSCIKGRRYTLSSGDLLSFGEVQCLFLLAEEIPKYLLQMNG